MRISLLLLPLLLISQLAIASRISGTYVSHGTKFTEMLQLTQTNDGQLSGTISWIELRNDGQVKSDHAQVTGAVDADQLTIKIGSGLETFLFGTSLSGTITGTTINLQTVDSHGAVSSHQFVRATATSFDDYAKELKAKGTEIILNQRIRHDAEQFRHTVEVAESWIADAELHAQRLPAVRARYRQIDDKMKSLVDQERTTVDSVARGQLSVAVSQGDIAGGQVDIDVDQLWDLKVESAGSDLYRTFTQWDGKCELPAGTRQHANAQLLQVLIASCKQAVEERDKFIPIFKAITQRRAELKAFETEAQARRKRLVDEAERLQ